jgi:hypothetical protein
MLAWPKVTRPPELGGLGISHLQQMGWSLLLRWPWLQKTEQPWAFLPIQVHHSVKAFFSVVIVSDLGNGQNTLFWASNWVHEQNLARLVPHLYGVVSKRVKKRLVFDAITNMRWVFDIRGSSRLMSWLNTWASGTWSIIWCYN